MEVLFKELSVMFDWFIDWFIMHSVNPYNINQPIGYRSCHNTSVL